MIEIGQTVGNYRVVAKIGEGGMGDVFLAEHPVIGRKAALKVIHPQHARNADVVARFVNEASSINKIGHEHIVEVTDFGRTPGGDFYFIMEYLEGQALSELIGREAPLRPAHALAIAIQIADALSASHAHGVIHRDLKPENVFLVARGDEPAFVKVLDFGLAKLVHDDGAAPHRTRAGIVMGTPFYMSPEQCEGAQELDERADVYALGVLLFEMLTGKLPFGGDGYAEVLMKQLTMQPPAARSVVPDLPEELDAILHRALAKAPAARFPTMAAFKAALLSPAEHATTPAVSIHDDLSGRMRAAHPMSRAEIRARRGPALPASTVDAFPERHGARGVAWVALAALVGLGLSAGLTFGWTTRHTALGSTAVWLPPTVPVTFSSEPGGATVVAPDGAKLGTTPLSIQVARAEIPLEYVFRKQGFESKAMSLVPNVASSVFAAMQAEVAGAQTAEADGERPPERRVVAATRHAAGRTAGRLHASIDDDGVIAPSFVKETAAVRRPPSP